jgi:hypothetical protein
MIRNEGPFAGRVEEQLRDPEKRARDSCDRKAEGVKNRADSGGWGPRLVHPNSNLHH